MNRLFPIALAAAAAWVLSGCLAALQTPAGSAPAEARECARNFSTTGSALSPGGKKYATHALIAGVSKSDAITRASRKIAQDGLGIVTIDRDGGLLVASNKTLGGKGNQDDSQLTVTFEGTQNAVEVSLTFASAFGKLALESDMQENLCSVVAAIEARR